MSRHSWPKSKWFAAAVSLLVSSSWARAEPDRRQGFPSKERERAVLPRPVVQGSDGSIPAGDQNTPAVNADDLRIRLAVPEGVFLIYDAVNPADGPRERPGYVACWNDAGAEQLFVFGRLLFEASEVGQALHLLQRDLGVDVVGLAAGDAGLFSALMVAWDNRDDGACWEPATRRAILDLMGIDTAGLPASAPRAEGRGEAEAAAAMRTPGAALGTELIEKLDRAIVCPQEVSQKLARAVPRLVPMPPGEFFDLDAHLELIVTLSGTECIPRNNGEDCCNNPDPCCYCDCCNGHCCTSCCNGACCHTCCGSYCCRSPCCSTVPGGCCTNWGGIICCGTTCCVEGQTCCPGPPKHCALAGHVCCGPTDCNPAISHCCDDHCCPHGQECTLTACCAPDAPDGTHYVPCAGQDHCCPTGSTCCGTELCCPPELPQCIGDQRGRSWQCCEAGQTLCGGSCCDPADCCEDVCCNPACVECIKPGSIEPGHIDVEFDPICLGELLVFYLVGAEDLGGIKEVGCSSEPDGPVPLTVTWRITTPWGKEWIGSGTVATVEADEIGTFTCEYTAVVDRQCLQQTITIGPETATVPGNYATVEIGYNTFIAPEAVETPPSFLHHDYHKGDNRWFGQGGTSRSHQTILVTVDPRNNSGQVGSATNEFGPTTSYEDNPTGSDVVFCEHCALPYGDWCLASGASPSCEDQAFPGSGGNTLTAFTQRIAFDEVKVYIIVIGHNPCEWQYDTPSIDVALAIHIRQLCINGVLQPPEFRAYGTYDGFPWHELYLRGTLVFKHDPCCTFETPNSLWPPAEHAFETYNPAADCSDPQPTGQPLGQWQPIP